MKYAAVVLLSLLVIVNTLSGQNPPAATPQAAATAEFNGMVDEYFNTYFHFHPTEGTYVGLHQYDSLLED